MRRLPADQLPRARARRRVVDLRKARKEAQRCAGLLGRDALRRHADPATDRLRDRAERHALVGCGVEPRPGRRRLQPEAIEPRGVERVHRRPAVGAIADVHRATVLAGQRDQRRHEARAIERAVHRRREPHHRRADAALGQRQAGLLRRAARPAAVVALDRDATGGRRRQHRRARGVHERLARALERRADRFDRAQVRRHRAGIVAAERDVVLERQVDDAVRRSGRRAQPVEIVEIPAPDQRPRRGQRRRRRVRAREPDDLMPGRDQLGDHRRTDVTGRAGDEDTHGTS